MESTFIYRGLPLCLQCNSINCAIIILWGLCYCELLSVQNHLQFFFGFASSIHTHDTIHSHMWKSFLLKHPSQNRVFNNDKFTSLWLLFVPKGYQPFCKTFETAFGISYKYSPNSYIFYTPS